MRQPRVSQVVTWSVLGAVLVATFVISKTLTIPSSAAAGPPDKIRLAGVVRDFRRTHPDFNVAPDAGFGHYAGNVAPKLGVGRRPVFNAGSDGNGPIENRIAHWKLNDGGGASAADEIGTNPGTVINGPTWTAGKEGGGLHFDGVNDYVNVPSSPEMQIGGDITFAGWFKLDEDFDATSPDTLVIMEKFLDTEHDFHIGLTGVDYNRPEVPKGALVFKVENGPTSDYYRYVWTNQASWTAGVWYHFAAVLVSGDTAQNRVFIDGIDDTSPVNAGGVGFVDTDYDAPMRFGGRTVDYNGLATDIYFKGTLDDIVIFNRALVDQDFTHSPGGYKVTAPWQDSDGNAIAPHLFDTGSNPKGPSFKVLLAVSDAGAPSAQDVSKRSMLQSWGHAVTLIDDDAAQSAYDVAVANHEVAYVSEEVSHGALGTKLRNAPIGVINEDKDLSDAEFGFSASKSTYTDSRITITDNDHPITQGFALGPLTVTTDAWNFSRADGALAPGGRGLADKFGQAMPVLMVVERGDALYGLGPAPARRVRLPWGNHSMDFNTINANGLAIMRRSLNWAATGNPPYDSCGNALADVAGSPGPGSDGGITGAKTFAHWFRDVPGTNVSAAHAITLTRDDGGVYSYLDDTFYPADGRLLGNENDPNNNYFTYALRSTFQYDACTNQFVELQGGDGVWLFIGSMLVLDLGGAGATDSQYASLDRLGLTDGQTYTFDLFYAQRRATASVFRLRTTLELQSASRPMTISAMFD